VCGLALLLSASAAAAQSPPEVTPYFADVTRVESWAFFEPRPGGGDPTYTLLGNRATLGVRVRGVRFDVEGAFEYGQLVGLPRRATVPGPLGPGALFYESARATRAYQLYFRTLSLRAKNLWPAVSIELGRMGYASGAARADRTSPLDDLRRARVEGRLVGEFEWSMFRRAFDGVRVDVERPRWRASGALLFPTQGGFEESANAPLSKLRLILVEGGTEGGTLVPPFPPSSHLQLFAYHYHDHRAITTRPDNSGLAAAAADISIATVGGAHTGLYTAGPGRIDSVVWAAAQTGDWYGEPHRAFSVAAEGGYQWSNGWRPWLRAGLLYASGDDDARDGRHRTFFPMVPSANRHVRSMAYATMNVRDAFAQVFLHPRPRLRINAEGHRVSLVEPRDRWYVGSGATARAGLFFGYTSRPSSLATSLGTIVEGAVDVELAARWNLTAYAGAMVGGDVVRRLFAGNRLRFVYVESVLRLQ
jgi:hypothetical protein